MDPVSLCDRKEAKEMIELWGGFRHDVVLCVAKVYWACLTIFFSKKL